MCTWGVLHAPCPVTRFAPQTQVFRCHPAAGFAVILFSVVVETSDTIAAHAHAAGLDEALHSASAQGG